MTNTSTVPRSFWIVSGLFLVWNLLGLMAFVAQVTMSAEKLAALPQAQQDLYAATPIWSTAAFAVAVFGGTLGCILLLLRKALAVPVLILSLAGVIIQMTQVFLMSPAFEVLGPSSVVAPSLVIIGAIFLVWYSKSSSAKGWIT